MINPSVPFTSEAFVSSASFMKGERKYTALVPTQLSRLAVAAEHDENVLRALKSFDAILVGGQSTPPALLDRMQELGVNVVTTYGSAETFGGVVYNGKPLDGVNISLTEDSLIEIQSPTLAKGQAPKFATNDIGQLVDGELQVIGRADRVIISGGIKVSLDRVEVIAREIPGVVELVAAPIVDPEWGQRVGLIYLGSPEVADEIAMQLADLLGPAAKPLRILRVDQVPKLTNGKYDLLAAAAIFAKDSND
jgi:O-succinylbenzoic acid--CoA ligase